MTLLPPPRPRAQQRDSHPLPATTAALLVLCRIALELVVTMASNSGSDSSPVGALRVFRLARLMRLARGSAKLKFVRDVFESFERSIPANGSRCPSYEDKHTMRSS